MWILYILNKKSLNTKKWISIWYNEMHKQFFEAHQAECKKDHKHVHN